MFKVDLHVHTKFSDGTHTVEEVLKLASNLNVREIAITDHDTIINIRNYKELESFYGIRIIPGVEIAANISGMHILGYGIHDFEMVESFLLGFKILNKEGAEKTVDILKNDGIDISIEKVETVMTSNIITKRDIVRYMIKRGYASNTLEVYKNFIGRGNKAYVPVHKIRLEDVLSLIEKSGGFSVLAHPYTLPDDTNFQTLIPYMKSYGLKGIEANTVRHTMEQKLYFEEIAKEYELIQTAGTDFHHASDGIMLGVEVEDRFLDGFHSFIKT